MARYQLVVYTPEKAAPVLERLSEGMSLTKACEEVGLSRTAFYRWLDEEPDLAAEYARCCRVGADYEFDQIQEKFEEMHRAVAAESEDSRKANAIVTAYRTEIDTRRWILARKNRRKYGDHHQVETNVNVSFKDLVDQVDGDAEQG